MTRSHTLSVLLFLTGAGVAFGTQAAQAQNLIQNGSFESGSFSNNRGNGSSLAVGSTEISNWTVVSGETAWLNNTGFTNLKASDGTFFLDLTGYHDSIPYGGVTQTFATTAGQSYNLAFDLGADPNDSIYAGPVGILASAGNTSQTFTFDPITGPGTQYQTENLAFTATGSSTAVTLIGAQGIQFIGLDNVVVTAAAVPEASTTVSFGLLLALGMGGVVIAAKKKKVAASA